MYYLVFQTKPKNVKINLLKVGWRSYLWSLGSVLVSLEVSRVSVDRYAAYSRENDAVTNLSKIYFDILWFSLVWGLQNKQFPKQKYFK